MKQKYLKRIKTEDQGTKAVQLKKQRWKYHHQQHKHRPPATDVRAECIKAGSQDE